jgi:uncharacterized protein
VAKKNSVTENSRQIVKRFYEQLAAGNFEAVLASLHEDIEIHEPGCLPYGGVYRGIAGVHQLFSQAPQHLDVGVMNVEAIVADGDRVVGFIRSAVVGTGAPTLIAEESIIRDGKIARVRVFHFDPMLVANAAKG